MARAQRPRLGVALRTLTRQDLPSGAFFPSPHVDLVHWRALGRHWFISRSPAHVEHVFIEGHDRYRKAVHYRLLATVTGNGLLTNEGEHWAAQRRLIQPVFAKRHLDRLVPHMAAATADFLDRWRPASPPATTDVAAAMTELTLDVVGRALFGATLADAADRLRPAVAVGMNTALAAARLQMILGVPRQLIDVAGDVVFRTPLPPPLRRIRRAMRTIDTVVREIVDDRIAAGGTDDSDLLGLLLGARDDAGQPMARQQVRDELVTMMLAGHETTANGLAWLWYLLDRHPEAQERLHDEVERELGGRVPGADDVDRLPWTTACFREALRLYPPAWVLEREATADDELDGERVPRGATVIFPVHLIHRDPRWWPDADRFDPARFLPGAPPPARGTYLPFGAGRRACVGATFAVVEGTTIAAMVSQRRRFELPADAAVEPSATVTLRPRAGLPMVVSDVTGTRRPAGTRQSP